MADVEEKKSKKKAPKEVANEDDAPEATEVKEEKAERKKKETDGTDSPRDGAKAPKLKLKSPRSEGATSQPTSPRAPTTPRGTPLDDEKDSTNLATFPVPKLFLRVLEVKDIGTKPKDYYAALFFDKVEEWTTKVISKKTQFDDGGRLWETEGKNIMRVVLMQKGLVGSILDSEKGEVVLTIADLKAGYPYDRWYDLTKKGKLKGKIRLQILQIPAGDEYYYDFFNRPLHVLIEKEELNLFQDAVEDTFADVNLVDEQGRTPLLLAAQKDQLKFVEVLVKKGVDVNAQKDKKGRTALHIAAMWRASKDLIKFLLKKKADVSAKDTNGGNTPLHAAAARNHLVAVELMLEKGAKINCTNDTGDTPVTSALLQDASDVVRFLLRNGADIYKKNEKDLSVWEISQRKDMVNTEPRKVFMEELNVHDAREFEFRTKYPVKATVMASRIHADYDKSTQTCVTTKTASKAVFLITTSDPNIKSLDFANKTGFVVVESDQGVKKEPSFQVTGARGIGGGKPRAIDIEPNKFYNVIPYSKTPDIEGEYMLIVLTETGSPVEISELAPWKYGASAEGDWVGKNAGGAQQHDSFKNNPMYEVTLPKQDDLEFCVFLSQEEDDPKFRLVQGGDHKIVNYGQHIGFYIMDRGAVKTLDQSVRWVDSRDTVKYVKLDTSERNHITIVPCTVNPGDESPFTLKVFCDEPVAIKEK